MTKGLILAGGSGTRLFPITKVVNKHLIPVGKYPMIHYPIRTLIMSGIKEIMVVTNADSMGAIAKLLGSGAEFGCNFYFRVQDRPAGISDGIRLARNFITAESKLMVILGDNLTTETFDERIREFERSTNGCCIFLKELTSVDGLGVARIERGAVTEIIEKPSAFVSNKAVTGIYLFDNRCFEFIEELYPSHRMELEVTDLINRYIAINSCEAHFLSGSWLDTGTFESLKKAGELLSETELRTGNGQLE
jgi:glucose-1-phosphate thymidylyltransferase